MAANRIFPLISDRWLERDRRCVLVALEQTAMARAWPKGRQSGWGGGPGARVGRPPAARRTSLTRASPSEQTAKPTHDVIGGSGHIGGRRPVPVTWRDAANQRSVAMATAVWSPWGRRRRWLRQNDRRGGECARHAAPQPMTPFPPSR